MFGTVNVDALGKAGDVAFARGTERGMARGRLERTGRGFSNTRTLGTATEGAKFAFGGLPRNTVGTLGQDGGNGPVRLRWLRLSWLVMFCVVAAGRRCGCRGVFVRRLFNVPEGRQGVDPGETSSRPALSATKQRLRRQT